VSVEPPGDRPRYAELPDGCAWDVLDPALGSLELLTPARVAAAAQLVRTGRRFSLDLPIDLPDPPFFGREPVQHTVFDFSDHILDDRLDSYFPQGSTQWDAFSHVAHTDRGFFGGHDKAAIRGSGALGIDAWHPAGVVGRGVLLDVARHTEIAPDSPFQVTPDLLDETASAQGVEVRVGDILCVRVGWLGWYLSLDQQARETMAEKSRTFEAFAVPGVGPGTATAEWLWDHGVAALAVDNPAVEPIPPSVGSEQLSADGTPFTADEMVHVKVLTMLGIPLGEFFDFEALAADCLSDGVYEFLFTSAPLGIPGGIGSPPNALALK
jgi:kynurenine formamidase